MKLSVDKWFGPSGLERSTQVLASMQVFCVSLVVVWVGMLSLESYKASVLRLAFPKP